MAKSNFELSGIVKKQAEYALTAFAARSMEKRERKTNIVVRTPP